MQITGDEDLQSEIDTLKQRVSELEEENQELYDKIEKYDRMEKNRW